MQAVIETIRPSFPGWPVERIKLALALYGLLESALEPARSRRGGS